MIFIVVKDLIVNLIDFDDFSKFGIGGMNNLGLLLLDVVFIYLNFG